MKTVCEYSHSSVSKIVNVVSFMRLIQMHTQSSQGKKGNALPLPYPPYQEFWVIAAAKYLLKLVNLHASCIFLKVKKSHFILK